MTDQAKPAIVSPDVARARFRAALRTRVGQGKELSVEMVGRETGLDPRTVRAYLEDGGNCPRLDGFLAIAAVLGPDFLNDVLGVVGFEGCRRTADADDNPNRAQLALAKGLYDIARWLEDGKLDHREQREAIPSMLTVVNQLQAFIAGLTHRVRGEDR